MMLVAPEMGNRRVQSLERLFRDSIDRQGKKRNFGGKLKKKKYCSCLILLFGCSRDPTTTTPTQSENLNPPSAPRDDLSGIFQSASVVSPVGLISTDSLTPYLAVWVAENHNVFSLWFSPANPVPVVRGPLFLSFPEENLRLEKKRQRAKEPPGATRTQILAEPPPG
jgi:hypothetical protein